MTGSTTATPRPRRTSASAVSEEFVSIIRTGGAPTAAKASSTRRRRR